MRHNNQLSSMLMLAQGKFLYIISIWGLKYSSRTLLLSVPDWVMRPFSGENRSGWR